MTGTVTPAKQDTAREPFWLARLLRRPRRVMAASIVVLALAGWAYCGLMVAVSLGERPADALGPGMAWLDAVAGPDFAPWLRAICRPLLAAPGTALGWSGFALVVAMWFAMALAMMLPTAAPMLLTYAELCETAARQREPFAAPIVLVAGYLAVWLAFAVLAAVLQILLAAAGMLTASFVLESRFLAAGVLAGAGLYQFSRMKLACLHHCRHPFTFFFANWSAAPRKVFRMGLKQGLACLGCCWAAMLVMFAAGVMNIVWMALLGAAMAAEKLARGVWASRAIGAGLLAAAAVFAVAR